MVPSPLPMLGQSAVWVANPRTRVQQSLPVAKQRVQVEVWRSVLVAAVVGSIQASPQGGPQASLGAIDRVGPRPATAVPVAAAVGAGSGTRDETEAEAVSGLHIPV